MASSFPNATAAIQELAQETGQESPPQESTANEFIDASLPIIIKGNEYYQELQDAGIRKEFLRHHDDTEKQLGTQRSYMEKEFVAVEKGFDDVDRKFKEFNGKMKTADGKLNTYCRWIDLFQDRIIEQRRYINEKLTVVDSKVARLDRKMERINTGIQELNGKLSNFKARRGFHQIHPVAVYDDAGGYSVPTDVPKTVRDFWRLKRSSRQPELVSLVKSYKISPKELLQPEGDESTDEQDDSDKNTRIDKLVELYPERAHQILAHRLGLDYRKISRYMLESKKKSPTTTTTNGDEIASDAEEQGQVLPSTSEIDVPAVPLENTDGTSVPPETGDENITLTLNTI